MAALFKILFVFVALFAIAYAMPTVAEAEKELTSSFSIAPQEVSDVVPVKAEEKQEANSTAETQHSREKRACRSITIGTRHHGSITAGHC